MTYQTGTATDLADLLSKLDTFATTTHGGWTQGYTPNPDTTNGWFELHKSGISVGAKYAVGAQAPVEHMSLHQATAYLNSSTAPGKHTGDSNNGYNTSDTGHTNAQILTERCVNALGVGPFPSYYFFAETAGLVDHIYVVVEVSTGVFRHFGFGKLVKFGDNWTGGEFVFGHYQDQSVSATAVDTNTTTLLDGLLIDEYRAATVRIGGLLNIGAAVWGVVSADASATLGTDQAGNPRRQVHGGFRVGMEARGFGDPVGNSSSGVIPLYQIPAYYRDPNNTRVQRLGYLPNVGALNIRNFAAAQEITIGVDTWVIFPLSLKTTASVANRSQYSGIAYRKVT